MQLLSDTLTATLKQGKDIKPGINWKAHFSAVENPHNLLHRTNSSKQGWMVLEGSSRETNTANRTQANQGMGKVPRLIPATLQDPPVRKYGYVPL